MAKLVDPGNLDSVKTNARAIQSKNIYLDPIQTGLTPQYMNTETICPYDNIGWLVGWLVG